MCRKSRRFQGQKAKGESTKTKKETENQSQAIWQTTHSVSRISFPSREARGKMIHDLGYCNNTDSWPVWYIFHSTCSFNVSSTIKQRSIHWWSFFSSPMARRGFLSLTLDHLLPSNNSPHVFCVTLWLNILICLQDVQFNLCSSLVLQFTNHFMLDFANMWLSKPSPGTLYHSWIVKT